MVGNERHGSCFSSREGALVAYARLCPTVTDSVACTSAARQDDQTNDRTIRRQAPDHPRHPGPSTSSVRI